jgi:hypothetical protein
MRQNELPPSGWAQRQTLFSGTEVSLLDTDLQVTSVSFGCGSLLEVRPLSARGSGRFSSRRLRGILRSTGRRIYWMLEQIGSRELAKSSQEQLSCVCLHTEV